MIFLMNNATYLWQKQGLVYPKISGGQNALLQFRHGVEKDPAALPAGAACEKEIPRLFAAESVKFGAGLHLVEIEEDSAFRSRQSGEIKIFPSVLKRVIKITRTALIEEIPCIQRKHRGEYQKCKNKYSRLPNRIDNAHIIRQSLFSCSFNSTVNTDGAHNNRKCSKKYHYCR